MLKCHPLEGSKERKIKEGETIKQNKGRKEERKEERMEENMKKQK